jgi:SpoIID/LytB domain protein
MLRSAKAATRSLALAAVALAALALPLALDAAPAGAYPATDVAFSGHGYGHGRGLGQWGAYGYATRDGWSWQQIIGHYYGGTTLGDQGNTEIAVRLVFLDGQDLTVTSSQPFTMGGVAIPAGGAGRFSMDGAGKVFLATAPSGGCGGTQTFNSGPLPDATVVSSVPDPGADLGSMLTICYSGGTRTYRGALRMVQGEGGAARVINIVMMESYLRGVVPRESPASWGNTAAGMNSLRAQAVAARSYAWAEARYSYARTCDTESCQVYLGAGSNGTKLEHPNSDQAITDTFQKVLKLGSGAVARAEFSSSTGGYTAGGTFPAVVDAGDDVSGNSNHNWTATVPVATIESAYAQFGLGTLQNVEVTSRNGLGADGGRALKVRFTGSSGNVDRTGDQVRSDFALKSNWFSIAPVGTTTTSTTTPGSPTTTSPPAPVPAGTWKWIVPTAVPPTSDLSTFFWGKPGDTVLLCDWNGDGVDTPGVFRDGTFSISNTQSLDPKGIYSFPYGSKGDTPLCGDWNGDRIDTVGIWRAGAFQLRNVNSPGPVQGVFRFGNPDDKPIVGDWNGDHVETPGIHRGDRFYFSNTFAPSMAVDKGYIFGGFKDGVVIGDWDGNLTDEPALHRDDRFYASDGNGGVRAAFTFGVPADRGVAGRFVPNATSDVIAIVRG